MNKNKVKVYAMSSCIYTNLVVPGQKIVPRIAQHSVGEDNILSETKQTQVNLSELSSSELKIDQLKPSECLRI